MVSKEICDTIAALVREEITVPMAIKYILADYAAGINGEAKYKNGFPFVDFLEEYLSNLELSEKDVQHGAWKKFVTDFNEIVYKFKVSYEQDSREYDSYMHSKAMSVIINDYPVGFCPVEFIKMIKDNWIVLGNYTYTFRALYSLVLVLDSKLSDSAMAWATLIQKFLLVALEDITE